MAKNLDKVFETINRRVGQLVKQSERDVVKRYAKTLAEIRALTATLYEKYEKDGVLTYADMAKFDRLRKFLNEVNSLLVANYKDVQRTVYDVLGEVYQEGYYLTAWAVETDAAAKLAYSTVTSETILEMINNPVSGLTLKQTLEKNRSQIIYRIQQEVTQGLVKGETYSTMAKRIKGALDGDATKAVRVVRTEGHRVQESSKHDSMTHADKQGVRMLKEWNTLEDERVRPGMGLGKKKRRSGANHRMLNGKQIPVSDNFVGIIGRGPAPGSLHAAGEDINCRCFLTYTVDRIEKAQDTSIESLGFDEWKKTRLKA
jgi:hypothetical protein